MYGYRKFISGFALSVSLWGGPTQAATYVYVSNAEDGTIGMYTMENDGTLKPGAAIEAGKLVMPMNVSPDKRFLFAVVRSQPFSAVSYRIDRATGALKLVAKAPLAESLPYIYSDKSGKWLLGASYGGHKVTVNPIGKDGEVGKESGSDGTQRARDPDRQIEQVCVRAPSRHRSGVPVSLRREDGQAFIEYASNRPDEIQIRSAPPCLLQRQQVRLSPE